jgi:hypothetical protein
MRQMFHLTLAATAALIVVLGSFGSVEAKARQDDPSTQDRMEDVRQELSSLREDVEDLQEPVEEFDLFDQCMFTIGVTQYGRRSDEVGYVYGRGGQGTRPALAMDMRGFDPPQYDFMAFPGEEPPQIECNEDAGGQDTDE